MPTVNPSATGYKYVKTSAGTLRCIYFKYPIALSTISTDVDLNADYEIFFGGRNMVDCSIFLGLEYDQETIPHVVSPLSLWGFDVEYDQDVYDEYFIIEESRVNFGRPGGSPRIQCPFLIECVDGWTFGLATIQINKIQEGASVVYPSASRFGYLVTDSNNHSLLSFNITPPYNLLLSRAITDNPPSDEPSDDPYDGDGDDESDEGGGPGSGDQDNWDEDGDSNPVPPLPGISATDTGFITLYNPSLSELQSLASVLWSNPFDITQFKKVVADPMDVILGLSILPLDVPQGVASEVKIGNLGTGVFLTKASAQFVELNCGTISLHEKWHSYLDYSPYTKVFVMLPYIGARELDVDQLQGTTLGIVYHIDILSGGCVAFVTVDGNVIAEYSGQCSVSVPITSQDFTQTISALCTLVAGAAGVGVTAATGGLASPVAPAMISGAATAAANTAKTVASSKPSFSVSGSTSGSNGLLANQKPYLIIERPKLCAPGQQNSYAGYPGYITRQMSSLSGYTQVQEIHLNVACTDSEYDEIMDLLRSGVIF